MVSARRGLLRISFRAAPGPPRVMFSVPRSVGTAVVRNRTRRRLREALRELVRDGAVVLASGDYRVRVSAPLEPVSAVELRASLVELAKDVRQ